MADEVLQETYIRMLNAPVMDELPRKAYLYKTATNLLRDRWRKQKREQKLWEMSEFTEQVHQKVKTRAIPISEYGCKPKNDWMEICAAGFQ